MSSRLTLPVVALATAGAYVLLGWALGPFPFARSAVGNTCLVASAIVAPAIIVRRRRDWSGCQRLFWGTLAVGMLLWVVGHLGWAYDELLYQQTSWLQWHTIFSLCGGVAPLIALLARPHLGPRPRAVTSVAIDLAGYGLLAVFVYCYFVLVPSLVASVRGEAEAMLLWLVQLNRLLLLAGLTALYFFARFTNWRITYLRLTLGVAAGLVLRAATNAAIARGDYYVGSIYDLAWIAPWLFFAWAARDAPASPPQEEAGGAADQPAPVAISAVPVLLVPALGYGLLQIDSMEAPIDSFRSLLTGLATVCGLVLLTVRLAAQRSELQRTDARLKLLAAATEQTGDLILITRADGRFEHANEAFLRALGYTRRELASMGFADLVEPGHERFGEVIPAEIAARGVWRGMLHRRRKDGPTFPASCTVAALKDDRGTVTHYVGVERDITEELKLRDQLVHSERLSAIGELIAGVAHEINNPLQTIVGCAELMLDDRPEAVNRRDIELVRQEAARAGQIVRNLLSFVRRSGDRTPIDLNDIVRATVQVREYHLRQSNISITVRCLPKPLRALVNREEIQQVLANLLLNAEHAISAASDRGSILIETGTDGTRHTIDVVDDGPGISPELRGRVFEPFFTTKDVGEGTGLGLSISHGIATAHGGSLEVLDPSAVPSARRAGRTPGACFRLTLPAYVERVERDGGPQEPVPGARLALVVDDEAPIRRLMARLLQRRGFEVAEADSAYTAFRLATERRFSVIFCDVRLHGSSGVDLFRWLGADDPDLKRRFVFITGGRTPSDPDQELGGVTVLAKPFTATDLETVLTSLGFDAPVRP